MPEGGAELERVAGRAPGRGSAVGGQAGDGLVELPAAQRWPQLNHSLDLGGSGISLGMGHSGGHDDRFARPGCQFLAVDSEPASPEVMMKRSFWPGWMCSVMSPPGTLRQLY